jgi:hypothetical protein
MYMGRADSVNNRQYLHHGSPIVPLLAFGRRAKRTLAIGLALSAFACATTDTRLLIAPDGSKALYVECSSGPVDCLEAISERCPRGYEILVQGTRGEILAGDKWTEMATSAVAAKGGLKTGGVQATSTTIREMLARCGRSTTASNDLKSLLDTPGSGPTEPTKESGRSRSVETEPVNPYRTARPHECGDSDASLKRDLREKWERILRVRDAGASQATTSAAFACRLVRQFFVQSCPDWDPEVPAIERAVCRIAADEAGRGGTATVGSDRASKSGEPVNQEDAP